MKNEISGILVVNKEKKFTSHDCVAILRRKLGIKRIGHTGTLDPMAEGLVTICIGSATRITDYTDWELKEYRCNILLGKSTETDDIWGKAIMTKDVDRYIDSDEVGRVLHSFLGQQNQLPPIYSAIKVDGKKLYEYARKGKEVEIKSREVFFEKIDLVKIDYQGDVLREIEIDVSCSKGTYIRSLCRDIGEKLGFPATMSNLVRTKSGGFTLDNSLSISEIKNMDKDEIVSRILPTSEGIKFLKKVEFQREEAKDFSNGKKLSLKKIAEKLSLDKNETTSYFKREESFIENYINNAKESKIELDPRDFSKKLGFKKDYFLVFAGNEFIGVGKIDKGAFVADKVFNTRMQNENF